MTSESLLRFTPAGPYIRADDSVYESVRRLLDNFLARRTMDDLPVDGTQVTITSYPPGIRVGFYPPGDEPPYPAADIRALYHHVRGHGL